MPTTDCFSMLTARTYGYLYRSLRMCLRFSQLTWFLDKQLRQKLSVTTRYTTHKTRFRPSRPHTYYYTISEWLNTI